MPQTRMPTDHKQRLTTVKNLTLHKLVSPAEKRRNRLKTLTRILETISVAPTTLSRTTTTILITTILTTQTTIQTRIQPKESQKLFIHPVRNMGKHTIPQRNANLEPMQPMDRYPSTEDQKDRIRSHKETIKTIQMKLLKLQPKI